MAVKVNSWNEFDPLKHVIVGRADHTCIPPSEPATEAKVPDDSDMRGMWGPRPLETVEKANEQLDNLAKLLESRELLLIVRHLCNGIRQSLHRTLQQAQCSAVCPPAMCC